MPRIVFVIDAPVFVMVDAGTDPEDLASEFDHGFSSAIQNFEDFGPGKPEILNAGVRGIKIANGDELDAVGVELEGDESDE